MLRSIKNPGVSQTDFEIVAAVSGKKIRARAVFLKSGGTAVTVTFKSKKASGTSTAVSPLISLGANDDLVLPVQGNGWFDDTLAGESLTVDTGTGSAVGISVLYDVVD